MQNTQKCDRNTTRDGNMVEIAKEIQKIGQKTKRWKIISKNQKINAVDTTHTQN